MPKSWLTTLLRVRGIQEDQALAKLAVANETVSGHRRRAAKERAMLAESGGSVTLAAAGIARASAFQKLSEIQAAEQAARGEVEIAQAGLQAARQALRSAELLKARRDAREASMAAKAEQNELDELASAAFHRRQQKEGS